MTSRVVVVEDDARFSEALVTALRATPDLEPVGAFRSIEQLRAGARSTPGLLERAHLCVMDLELPGESGLDGIRMLKRAHPHLSVVVCTVFEEPSTLLEAICAGADGYLLKRTRLPELLAQLRLVGQGGAPLSAGVARRLLNVVRRMDLDEGPAPTRVGLSEREQEVLRHLVDGLSYKQVAAELDVSTETVRTYIKRLYKKLQVHSVAEAVSKAIRHRLV